VAIRKSAAAEIEHLIDDLCGADPVARETAGARLAIIGGRAVPHLVATFGHSVSAVARAAILKVLEASPDRRGVDLAIEQLDPEDVDPKVQTAAVALLGAHLDGAESPMALDRLSAMALGVNRSDGLRLQALDAIARALPHVLKPLRKRLSKDPSPAVRGWASRGVAAAGLPIDPRSALESVAAGEAADPSVLRDLVPSGATDAPLPILHRLIEIARTREDTAPAEADRLEWHAVRGSVHLALARRGSLVAVYDLRETLAGATGALPAGFVEATALVGDGSCLEPIAESLARFPAKMDRRDQQWRDDLLQAGRAIVQRERLTRRHAVIRKIAKVSPDVASVLLAPAARQD
jgi:hypothetical protein